jgi:hypothetical protein
MVRGTKEPYAPRHRCQAGKPVGNEIVQARLALQTWRPQCVACIGGANASVLAVMELLEILYQGPTGRSR